MNYNASAAIHPADKYHDMEHFSHHSTLDEDSQLGTSRTTISTSELPEVCCEDIAVFVLECLSIIRLKRIIDFGHSIS